MRWMMGVVAAALVLTACGSKKPSGTPETKVKWEVDSTSVVAIDDDSDSLRTFTRVVGIKRLGNGEIVARDLMNPALRIFSADGTRGRLVGRDGSGPGDLSIPAWYDVQHDTLFVHDDALHRVSAFDSAGKFLTSRDVKYDRLGTLGIEDRFDDGAWLLRGPGRELTEADVPMSKAHRVPVMLAWTSPDGGQAQTISASEPDVAILTIPRGNGSMTGQQRFGPELFARASGDAVWVGDSDTNVVRLLGRDGKERRRFTLPFTRLPITQEMIDFLQKEDYNRARSPEVKANIAQRFKREYLPTHAPYYTQLVVTRDGELWFEQFALGRLGPATYHVAAPDGTPLGTFDAPAGFRVKDAGKDWVLGIYTTPDEVESVRMYTYSR